MLPPVSLGKLPPWSRAAPGCCQGPRPLWSPKRGRDDAALTPGPNPHPRGKRWVRSSQPCGWQALLSLPGGDSARRSVLGHPGEPGQEGRGLLPGSEGRALRGRRGEISRMCPSNPSNLTSPASPGRLQPEQTWLRGSVVPLDVQAGTCRLLARAVLLRRLLAAMLPMGGGVPLLASPSASCRALSTVTRGRGIWKRSPVTRHGSSPPRRCPRPRIPRGTSPRRSRNEEKLHRAGQLPPPGAWLPTAVPLPPGWARRWPRRSRAVPTCPGLQRA